MLVGVVVVHITSGLVSLVLVGVVVVVVRAGVVSDISAALGVVRARVVSDISAGVGVVAQADHTELGGGNSQKGTSDLWTEEVIRIRSELELRLVIQWWGGIVCGNPKDGLRTRKGGDTYDEELHDDILLVVGTAR